MRLIVFISGIFIALVLIISCVNNKTNNTVENKNVAQKLAHSILPGVYQGELPCTDCEAIVSYLTLMHDHSYSLSYTYAGKSEEVFVKEGLWKLEDNELTLQGVDYKYRIEDKKLRQLDLAGKEIRGELAEKYVLRLIDK